MSEKEMSGVDGSYGDTCIAFIEYRRSLGYKYEGRIVRAINVSGNKNGNLYVKIGF